MSDNTTVAIDALTAQFDESFLLLVLAGIAVIMTVGMFAKKEPLLGFPSAIFWLIFGGYCFTLASGTWADIHYYIFFASAVGMTIFCILSMFALREKTELVDESRDRGKYFDEEPEELPSDDDREIIVEEDSLAEWFDMGNKSDGKKKPTKEQRRASLKKTQNQRRAKKVEGDAQRALGKRLRRAR